MRSQDLTLAIGLCLLLAVASLEAHLSPSLSEPSNELDYYLARSLVPRSLEAALQLNSANRDQNGGEEAAGDFPPLPEVNADDSRLVYLANAISSRSQPNGAADFQKLVETIEELARQEEQGLLLNNELNQHLPSSDPYSTEGPINNPMEFEAAMSQLTNALNHGIPNTSNRSAVLDNLLSSLLGSVARGLQLQQSGDNLVDTTNSYNLTGLLNQKSDNDDNDVNYNEQVHSNKQHAGSEYIDQPLVLIGHQYVQGGAGEGRQLLGPDGSFENVQVVKSDRAVPSYCDPPNPCPIGWTAEDGCLERFVNSASFSREYQVKQKCSCDNEHSLFNCGSPTANAIKNYASGSSSPSSKVISDEADNGNDIEQPRGGGDGDKLDTLARAIQNRYGNLESIRNLINEHEQNY